MARNIKPSEESGHAAASYVEQPGNVSKEPANLYAGLSEPELEESLERLRPFDSFERRALLRYLLSKIKIIAAKDAENVGDVIDIVPRVEGGVEYHGGKLEGDALLLFRLKVIDVLPGEDIEDFLLGLDFFEKNKGRLVKKFRGRYIAVVGKQVIDYDDNFGELANRVFRERGYRDALIHHVGRGTRAVRLRSPRKALQGDRVDRGG